MKDKYVEQNYPTWMEFGKHPDGCIDIATVNSDVGCHIARDEAERLMREHNRCIDALCKLADAFDKAAPEAFKKYWYITATHTEQE